MLLPEQTKFINGPPMQLVYPFQYFSALGFITPPVAPTYGATVTIDCKLGAFFIITVTDGVDFTISNPIGDVAGITINIMVRNTSGGAMGAVTLGSDYNIGAAFAAPATGKSRTYQFYCEDAINWTEIGRTAADVAN